MKKSKVTVIFISILLVVGVILLATIYVDRNVIPGEEKLIISGKCRPLEKQCEITGSGLRMNIVFMAPPSYQRLLLIILDSKTSLDKVAISLIIDGEKMPPTAMQTTNNKNWKVSVLPFASITPNNLTVRLRVSTKDNSYFSEFPIEN